MQSFRAIIFDMDGVIVNSEPHHERAFREVLAEIGYPNLGGLVFSDYVGRADSELWVDFIARHRPAHSLEALLSRKRHRMIKLLREAQPLFPGLPELVAQLARRCPLALASGSEHPIIQTVLSLDGLHRHFRVVVSATDVARGKPAPDIFWRAAKLLQVAPADCVVIEDSKPGVAAGRAAGMQVVAITNTHPAAELGGADQVVESYDELAALLLPGAGSGGHG